MYVDLYTHRLAQKALRGFGNDDPYFREDDWESADEVAEEIDALLASDSDTAFAGLLGAIGTQLANATLVTDAPDEEWEDISKDLGLA